MTTRRRGCLRVAPAARSRRFSSTWRAAAASGARRHNDRAHSGPLLTLPRSWGRAGWGFFPAPRRGDDAALLVSVALVLAAAGRARLLADGADDHLGLSAVLHHAEGRLFCPCRRHADRCGAALGHPVPRPARLLALVPRGD